MKIAHFTIVIALITLISIGSCNTLLAQESAASGPPMLLQDAMVYPGTLLYPMKILMEELEKKVAFRKDTKREKQLQLMDRRIAEVYQLMKRNDEELIDSTLERYKSLYAGVQSLTGNNTKSQKLLVQETLLQIKTMQFLLTEVQTKTGRRAIISLLDSFQRNMWQLVAETSDPQEKQSLTKIMLADLTTVCQLLDQESRLSIWNQTEQSFLYDQGSKCNARVSTSASSFL